MPQPAKIVISTDVLIRNLKREIARKKREYDEKAELFDVGTELVTMSGATHAAAWATVTEDGDERLRAFQGTFAHVEGGPFIGGLVSFFHTVQTLIDQARRTNPDLDYSVTPLPPAPGLRRSAVRRARTGILFGGGTGAGNRRDRLAHRRRPSRNRDRAEGCAGDVARPPSRRSDAGGADTTTSARCARRTTGATAMLVASGDLA